MQSILQEGAVAPDFTLPVSKDITISLSDFKGSPLILAFYPADWTPVCGNQMSLYNELLSEFQKHNAKILGISVDSSFCHTAFAESKNLHFPLLADFEPKGEFAKEYGVYDDTLGMCERALFVIDKNGIIAWSYLSPRLENPGADGILEALEKLSIEDYSYAANSNHRSRP